MLTVFFAILGVLVYAWVVYPGIMLLIGRRTGRVDAPHCPDEHLPAVAIIFSAHNEEKVIGARIANLLSLDYPRDRIRIYAGADGCTDRTESIIGAWAETDSRIHIVSRQPCAGKTSMLKRLESEVRSRTPNLPLQLLVFTDANTQFSPDALRLLVAPFGDKKIGGVCGHLILGQTSDTTSPASAGTDEPIYWNLETSIKAGESRIDSCLGANGAIYAIRLELFPQDIPDNTIIDDFVIGMKVREQGFRMVYEPGAVAHEDLPETVRDEWRRRVRIGAGAYQALGLCRACLLPRYGWFSVFFWSHKVLRWLTPQMMVLFLLSGGWLVLGWWRGTEDWVVQLAGVGAILALLVFLVLVATTGRVGKFYDRLIYFATMQGALFVGFLRYCRGNLKGTWERTERAGRPHH